MQLSCWLSVLWYREHSTNSGTGHCIAWKVFYSVQLFSPGLMHTVECSWVQPQHPVYAVKLQRDTTNPAAQTNWQQPAAHSTPTTTAQATPRSNGVSQWLWMVLESFWGGVKPPKPGSINSADHTKKKCCAYCPKALMNIFPLMSLFLDITSVASAWDVLSPALFYLYLPLVILSNEFSGIL